MSTMFDVYLEIGSKRAFAGSIAWPGWCRSGRDENAALQALLDYGPRYARVLRGTQLEFDPPNAAASLKVVERLEGNPTTDFGAPDASPASDSEPVSDYDLTRLQTLLKAYWQAFDLAVEAASGKTLRKGPRGGGREVEAIVRHMLGAEISYLRRLMWKFKEDHSADLSKQLEQARVAVLAGLAAAAHGETPTQGPRGGAVWTPRYFVRRAGWHILDHAWEIEDRIE